MNGEAREGAGWRRPAWRLLQPTIGLLAIVLAIVTLQGELRDFHYRQVEAYVASIAGSEIGVALLIAFISLLLSSSLDLLALRHLRRKVPLRAALLSSFVANSVSNCVSPALIMGSALRFRLYAALGLSAEDVGVLVVFGASGFWLGFLSLAAGIFLVSPHPLPPSIGLSLAALRTLGAVFGAIVLAYLVACGRGTRAVRIRGWELRLPSLGLALAQTLTSALDWLFAAAALWWLAPDFRSVPFAPFFAVYLGAQAAGLASHVPAGLGVFEAVVVHALAPHAPAAEVLGSLAAYRVVYYLAPLAASLVALGVIEARRGAVMLEGVRQEVARWLAPWVPSLLAIATFVGGSVLLVSGATPGDPRRLLVMEGRVPLPLLESSHVLASVVGALLLLVARGLQQRLDAAYLLSCLLLALGMAFSLLKGLDYEEAALLLAILLATLPARRHFYRRASLTRERFSLGWIVAMIAAVAGSVVIGLFAFHHVPYTADLWSRFALLGHASRSLRASLGAAGIATTAATLWLLRPAPRAPRGASPADLDAVQAIVSRELDPRGALALLGDKALMFDEEHRAFLMYATQGRSWVALGDPVGPESKWSELCWRFREAVDRAGGRAAFYDVGAASLPRYIEMGLTLLKLGDEARVALPRFTLEGTPHKSLRQTLNHAERQGATFEVLEAEQVPEALDALQLVSDRWLERKRTREKGFSVGFFDRGYLARGPVAVVRRGGRIVAFANVWRGAPGGELSVDLMRYDDDAPKGVMDLLFIQLMRWGQAQGHAWFNLGMAPLSGLSDHALAPVWNRVGTLLFRYGEDYYNFQGLRQFKEKFDPQWVPRYLACPGGLGVAGLLLDVASLNSRGLKGVVGR